MPILTISNHSIHKAKEVGPQSTKGDARGLVPKMQDDILASEPGGHVALRTDTRWALI